MKKLTFNVNLITPSDIWRPIKGFLTRKRNAVVKFFRDKRTQRRCRKNEHLITSAWAVYAQFPEHQKWVEKESIALVKTLVNNPDYTKDLKTWAVDEAFKLFESDVKERESVAAMFNHFFGKDRSTSAMAKVVAENIFTQEIAKRSWGRSVEIKKGGKHYILIFITTPEGEFRFNIGRYPEEEIPEIGKEGVVLVGERV